MRELTTNELNAVSGGLTERPRLTFSVTLSARDRAALAAVIRILGSRRAQK